MALLEQGNTAWRGKQSKCTRHRAGSNPLKFRVGADLVSAETSSRQVTPPAAIQLHTDVLDHSLGSSTVRTRIHKAIQGHSRNWQPPPQSGQLHTVRQTSAHNWEFGVW